MHLEKNSQWTFRWCFPKMCLYGFQRIYMYMDFKESNWISKNLKPVYATKQGSVVKFQ